VKYFIIRNDKVHAGALPTESYERFERLGWRRAGVVTETSVRNWMTGEFIPPCEFIRHQVEPGKIALDDTTHRYRSEQ
jgi:hypothetical protein